VFSGKKAEVVAASL